MYKLGLICPGRPDPGAVVAIFMNFWELTIHGLS